MRIFEYIWQAAYALFHIQTQPILFKLINCLVKINQTRPKLLFIIVCKSWINLIPY